MTIRHEADSDVVVGLRVEYETESQIPGLLAKLERRIYIEQGRAGLDHATPGLCMMGIVMPCGHRYLFHTKDDIPRSSLPCDCGKEGHWVVFYEQISTAVVPSEIWP
jgi:hypothetical protein